MEWKSLRISILYFHERSIYSMIAEQLKKYFMKNKYVLEKNLE